MATLSQQVRAEQQRAAQKSHPKKKSKKGKRQGGVDTALPGVSATDRRAGNGHTASRNASKHAAKKAAVKLEDSATGRPSRKSTRKSKSHIKRTTNQQLEAIRRSTAPSTRANRAKAAKKRK